MTTATLISTVLAAVAAVAVLVVIRLWLRQRATAQSLRSFNAELIAVSGDSSVGRRLGIPEDPEAAQLAHTVNRLFDALGERDRKLEGRDRLFRDFARTLPEIVIVHDEKILLANESAASLVGLEPAQLVGRDVADLVKPAYWALFRKNVAERLAGESAPRRLEIQFINGNETGLWVEAQSTSIEFHGSPAILTVARDVSHRKSLEVSLTRSKRQAQFTLESIAEGVITTDNDGRIDYMNLAAEALTGANREEAAGHKVGEVFTLVDDADRRPLGDPVERLKQHLITEGHWTEAKHEKLVEELRAEVLAAWKEAQTYGTMTEGPFLDPTTMFDDVYADPPERLEGQRRRMLEIERNGGGR